MKEMVSVLILSLVVIVSLLCILTAVLVYYNKPVNHRRCKSACMSNCTTCRRNCEMRNKSVAIEERYKDNKIVSVMLEKT